MHLNKFLAQAGIAARRKTAELIKARVVAVNNKIITDPAYLVQPTDVVTVKSKRVIVQEPVYILLNKPMGYVTTTSDEKGRPTVIDLLGKQVKEKVYPVGRLDQNSTGLLLLTNHGAVAQRLAHPKYGIKKMYQVTLDKPLVPEVRNRIIKGVRLNDGLVRVDRISHPLGPLKNCVRLTLHSGKYRVVRRLFEHVGFSVKKLDRIGYAMFRKQGLPVGMWRYLTKKEVSTLQKLLG
jgi:23S rRNA pseudouridine2605 synthase